MSLRHCPLSSCTWLFLTECGTSCWKARQFETRMVVPLSPVFALVAALTLGRLRIPLPFLPATGAKKASHSSQPQRFLPKPSDSRTARHWAHFFGSPFSAWLCFCHLQWLGSVVPRTAVLSDFASLSRVCSGGGLVQTAQSFTGEREPWSQHCPSYVFLKHEHLRPVTMLTCVFSYIYLNMVAWILSHKMKHLHPKIRAQ